MVRCVLCSRSTARGTAKHHGYMFSALQEVVDGPQTRISSSQSESTLLISHTMPHHRGTYTLVVRHRHGLQHHSIYLSVIGERGKGAGLVKAVS